MRCDVRPFTAKRGCGADPWTQSRSAEARCNPEWRAMWREMGRRDEDERCLVCGSRSYEGRLVKEAHDQAGWPRMTV